MQGEKMHLNLRFNKINTHESEDNRFGEFITDTASSTCMDYFSSAFKNNKKGYFNELPFNDVLSPKNISVYIVFNYFEFKYHNDLNYFNMNLSSGNTTSNKLNSFLTHNEDIFISNVSQPDLMILFQRIPRFDFLS